MKKLLLIVMLSLSFASFASDPYKNFPGQYTISGKTVLDSPAGEPQNTHIYFRIMGDAAKEMYSMVDAKPERDICLDDGTLTKSAESIKCDFNPKDSSYICYFSVGVQENSIGLGVVC